MENKIRLVIADDSDQLRESIVSILKLESHIEIIGEARNGAEAVELAKHLKPDIILMDINMPEMDGLKATQVITEEGLQSAIIIMSIQGEKEYIKKAMSAGARDYIIKPFGINDILETIRRVHEMEEAKRKKLNSPKSAPKIQTKVISVFSTKGGVGKTTIATNLAVSMAGSSGKKIALLDLNLQFGDVAICLNVYIKNTISELIKDIEKIEQDHDSIEEYLLAHYSGVKVLAAPLRPENAEYVTADHVKRIIEILRGRYDYIIIDTCPGFQDTIINALDASDTIIYVSTLDLPAIKNTKNGLDVMKTLNYPKEKVKIVVNKSNESFGIKCTDFQSTLNVDIWNIIPEDTASVTISVNNGHPLVSHRKASNVAKKIHKMAQSLVEGEAVKRGLFK